jgi:FAD/FMN-containing dehydrogenase
MSAFDELQKIVGKSNFSDTAETLDLYGRDESFVLPIKPACVVYPQNANMVTSVLKWANETKTPVVPVSSGGPHFRGDTVPTIGGAVVMDMSRMKKIIRVSYREQLALVEPGVTFAELASELEKEGLMPHMPLVPRFTKSIIGSYMEKEPIIQPRHHWCPVDPLLACQLILGSSDLLQTGSSKGVWTLEEEWKHKKHQKWWASESYDIVKIMQGSQGSVGVLTWSSVKCALLPKIHNFFFVPCTKIDPLIEVAYTLLRFRWGEELFILNSQTLASIFGKNSKDIVEIRDALPRYILIVGIAGFPEFFPEERAETQERDIREVTERFGVQMVPTLSGISGEKLRKTLYKVEDETYWKMRQKGAFQDIFFATTLDFAPLFIDEMYGLAAEYGYSSQDIGVYVQPMVQGTSCHLEFQLPYDPVNSREAGKVKDLVTRGARALAAKNAYFYRPYGAWKGIAYERFGGEEYAAIKKIKPIFDPNDIMNPGKICF